MAIAVSGGADSICLLHALHLQQQLYPSTTLHILTCDHNTRENIQKEIDLVAHASKDHRFVCFRYKGTDYREEVLRQRRHEQWIQYCQDHKISILLTGHHLDDRIETTLLNMKRGTHINGILNMSVSEPHFLDPHIHIIRPLLAWRKEDILHYCQHHHLEYVNDPSNADPTVSERNDMRLLLQQHFHTSNRHQSWKNVYDSFTIQQKRTPVEIITGPTYDLCAISTGEWTSSLLHSLYQYYKITINPRANTLTNLCEQLNKQSGNSIHYQGLIITAYRYGSTIRQQTLDIKM